MLVNIDEHNGVPSQPRADVPPPPHWRLDAIAAVGRPHDLVASADGSEVAFVLDATMPPTSGRCPSTGAGCGD